MRLLYKLLPLLCLVASVAHGQQNYSFPLRDVQGLYSASYGELRRNHFHSGVDIRTDAKEGKEVVAVADGYVSRISVAPRGFGLALYITHPSKGTMSVYAHLSHLRKDMEAYVVAERYRQRKNSITLMLTPDKFPVKQGDVVAYSGNSGSSYGPHLHFELRDVRTGHTLNPVRKGAITPHDTIPPQIVKLHYVTLDSLGRGLTSNIRRSYTPELRYGEYRIPTAVAVATGGQRGHFVLEVCDRRNGTNNRFGIYRVEMSINGKSSFEYKMDHFAFADTRQCNVVSYYPLQQRSKNEIITLTRSPYAPRYLYGQESSGKLPLAGVGDTAEVVVEVEDECGNTSVLRFIAKGERMPLLAKSGAQVVDNLPQNQRFNYEGYSLSVPKGALYGPIELSHDVPEVVIKETPLVRLSPLRRVMSEGVLLNRAVKVSLAVKAPAELQRHLAIARLNSRGEWGYLGGKYSADSVTVSTRSGGLLAVVADTIAPTITPRFREGDNLTASPSISFAVKDNFSGISSYMLYIDNEWRTLDLHPIKRTLTHTFDKPLRMQGRHNVRLVVTDGCGNSAVYKGAFVR